MRRRMRSRNGSLFSFQLGRDGTGWDGGLARRNGTWRSTTGRLAPNIPIPISIPIPPTLVRLFFFISETQHRTRAGPVHRSTGLSVGR